MSLQVRISGILLRSVQAEQFFTAYTEHAVERAQKRPLEEERIRTQLAKTGGTLFFLKDIGNSMDPGCISSDEAAEPSALCIGWIEKKRSQLLFTGNAIL